MLTITRHFTYYSNIRLHIGGTNELLDVAAFRDQESFQAVCQRDRDLDSLVVVNLLINIKKASV